MKYGAIATRILHASAAAASSFPRRTSVPLFCFTNPHIVLAVVAAILALYFCPPLGVRRDLLARVLSVLSTGKI